MVAIAGLKPAAYKRRTGSSPVSRTIWRSFNG